MILFITIKNMLIRFYSHLPKSTNLKLFRIKKQQCKINFFRHLHSTKISLGNCCVFSSLETNTSFVNIETNKRNHSWKRK